MTPPTAVHASFRMMWLTLFAAAFILCRAPAGADEVTLAPIKDNTIYSEGEFSNGAGDLFAGVTARTGQIRRALLAFDIAGNVPAGSTVTGVRLILQVTKTTAGTEPMSIHRLLADWGEGTSISPGQGGQGAPATAGDATWTHRFFDTELWLSPGGDFVADPSASQDVGGNGSYTWGSTAQMVADVQAWLATPGANFGWLVQGNETTGRTTKRFTSREADAAVRPKLVVQFTGSGPGTPTPTPTPTEVTTSPTPTPQCTGDCNGMGTVKTSDILTLVDILLGDAQPPACPHGIPTGSPIDITLIIKAANNALGSCLD